MKFFYSAIALIAVAVIYHFNIISQHKDQESLRFSKTNQESNDNKNTIIEENFELTVLKNKVTNSIEKNGYFNKTNPIVANANKN